MDRLENVSIILAASTLRDRMSIDNTNNYKNLTNKYTIIEPGEKRFQVLNIKEFMKKLNID